MFLLTNKSVFIMWCRLIEILYLAFIFIFVFNNNNMFHSVSTYLVSLDCKLIVSHRCHASFGWLLQIFSSLKFLKKISLITLENKFIIFTMYSFSLHLNVSLCTNIFVTQNLEDCSSIWFVFYNEKSDDLMKSWTIFAACFIVFVNKLSTLFLLWKLFPIDMILDEWDKDKDCRIRFLASACLLTCRVLWCQTLDKRVT